MSSSGPTGPCASWRSRSSPYLARSRTRLPLVVGQGGGVTADGNMAGEVVDQARDPVDVRDEEQRRRRAARGGATDGQGAGSHLLRGTHGGPAR